MQKVKNIALILFLVCFIGALVVYFQFERATGYLFYTWLLGIISGVCYLIYRFLPNRMR